MDFNATSYCEARKIMTLCYSPVAIHQEHKMSDQYYLIIKVGPLYN